MLENKKPNRRDFMKTSVKGAIGATLATVGFPTIVPAAVLDRVHLAIELILVPLVLGVFLENTICLKPSNTTMQILWRYVM